MKYLKLNSSNKIAFCNKGKYDAVFSYASQHDVI